MRVVRNFILAALCVSNNFAAAQPQSLSRSRFIEVEVYRDRGLSRSLMPQIPTHAAQFRTRPECYNLASKLFCAGRRQVLSRPVAHVGEWLSLVEHLVRDQGVGGSNPLSPTNSTNYKDFQRFRGSLDPWEEIYVRRIFRAGTKNFSGMSQRSPASVPAPWDGSSYSPPATGGNIRPEQCECRECQFPPKTMVRAEGLEPSWAV